MSTLQTLEGTEYFINGTKYRVTLEVYQYGGGTRINIFGWDEDHKFWEPDACLTHNLELEDLRDPYTLESNEIFVKAAMLKYFKDHLRELEFSFTGKLAGYGPGSRMSEVWAYASSA